LNPFTKLNSRGLLFIAAYSLLEKASVKWTTLCDVPTCLATFESHPSDNRQALFHVVD